MASVFQPGRDQRQYSSTAGLSGWAAIARTVRDFDEEKIRDCKEDIDTLLVFAGLFSAVLTAFLIESYHNLQPPDPTAGNAEMTGLLREIATYTRASFEAHSDLPVLAAVTSPSAATPYDPPTTAVRINTLWFASLVFALATASFGMLVKQWLREYLACDHTSPLARLRIRQYRNPGMRTWKVFEIAAVLPLLLQLSLALFFIGLCIFTWSINRTVARTTICLVCAWAFFIVASTILPIFFPLCAYRTSAFLRLTRSLRRRWFTLRRHIATLGSTLNRSHPNAVGATFTVLRVAVGALTHVAAYEKYADEDSIAVSESNDTDVMRSVDETLTDDNMLATTIWETLQQLQLDSNALLRFILDVLQSRIRTTAWQSDSGITGLLDLRSLSLQAWQTVLEMASLILARELDVSGSSGWSDEAESALLIVLSRSKYTLTASHGALLDRALGNTHRNSCRKVLARLATRAESPAQIVQGFQVCWRDNQPSTVLSGLRRLASVVVCDDCEHSTLWQLAAAHRTTGESQGVFWHEVLLVLLACLGRIFQSPHAPDYQSQSEDILRPILSIPAIPSARDEMSALFMDISCDDAKLNLLYRLVAEAPLDAAGEWTAGDGMRFMHTLFQATLNDSARLAFLNSVTAILKRYQLPESPEKSPDVAVKSASAVDINYMRLCWLLLVIFSPPGASVTSTATVLVPLWRSVWDLMAGSLVRLAIKADRTEHARIAVECFSVLDACAESTATRRVEMQGGVISVHLALGCDDVVEPFPDALFAVLSVFVADPTKLEHFHHIQHHLDRAMMPLASPEPRLRGVLGEKNVWQCLHESGLDLPLLFPRLLHNLSARIPSLRFDIAADDLPDLTELSQRTWLIITDIAATIILQWTKSTLWATGFSEEIAPQDFKDSLLLLLSRSRYPIPPKGETALYKLFSSDAVGMICDILRCYSWSASPMNLAHVLRRLRTLTHFGSKHTYDMIHGLSSCAFHRAGNVSGMRWYSIWNHLDLDCDEFWLAIHDIALHCAGDITSLLDPKQEEHPYFDWNFFYYASCCRIPATAVPQFHNTLRQLLLHPTDQDLAARVYFPVVRLWPHGQMPRSPNTVDGICAVYSGADDETRCRLLQVFRSIVENYSLMQNRISDWEQSNPIRICLLHLHVYGVHRPFDPEEGISHPSSGEHCVRWNELWRRTAFSLQIFQHVPEKGFKYDKRYEVAMQCFELLDKFESQLLDDETDTKPPFPYELYAALVSFIDTNDTRELTCLPNIQRRLPASHRQPRAPTVERSDIAGGGAVEARDPVSLGGQPAEQATDSALGACNGGERVGGDHDGGGATLDAGRMSDPPFGASDGAAGGAEEEEGDTEERVVGEVGGETSGDVEPREDETWKQENEREDDRSREAVSREDATGETAEETTPGATIGGDDVMHGLDL